MITASSNKIKESLIKLGTSTLVRLKKNACATASLLAQVTLRMVFLASFTGNFGINEQSKKL